MIELPDPLKISARELAKKFEEAEANYVFIDTVKARDLQNRGYKVYRYTMSDKKARFFNKIGRPVYFNTIEWYSYVIEVPLNLLEKRD